MALQAVFMHLQHGYVYSFKLQINCKLKRSLGLVFLIYLFILFFQFKCIHLCFAVLALPFFGFVG